MKKMHVNIKFTSFFGLKQPAFVLSIDMLDLFIFVCVCGGDFYTWYLVCMLYPVKLKVQLSVNCHLIAIRVVGVLEPFPEVNWNAPCRSLCSIR